MRCSAQIAALPFGLSTAIADAGPCSDKIQRNETAVNQPSSPYMPTLPQIVDAQISAQPTVSLVARAEERALANYKAVLDRARATDHQNNQECQKVVEDLKNLVGLR